MEKCPNCEVELKENYQIFCAMCDKKLTFEQKQFVLYKKTDEALSGLSELLR